MTVTRIISCQITLNVPVYIVGDWTKYKGIKEKERILSTITDGCKYYKVYKLLNEVKNSLLNQPQKSCLKNLQSKI